MELELSTISGAVRYTSLKKKIHSRLESLFNTQVSNPVIKATQEWKNVDELLKPFLGDQIYNQWFKEIKPLFLKNDILVLQTKDKISASWINTHYQELVENILKIQNKNLSCFFIAPKKHRFENK